MSSKPRDPQTDLGIIIVSWNVREDLDRCLTSLCDALNREQYRAQTWVLDNGSVDGSAELVEAKYPWVHLEARDTNLGYVRGNNIAMAQLLDTAAYLWLLNPDTIVRPGAITTLLGFFDTEHQAGLVGPKLLNPDGSLQESAFRFPGLTQALFGLNLMPERFYYSALNGRYSPEQYTRPDPFRVDHPLGAAMMARTEAVQSVGLLDERFFMYCEEIDWAWRMRKAGWQSWLVPTAEVVHVGGASSRQAPPETTACLWESRAYLYSKHRRGLVSTLAALAVRFVFARRLKQAETDDWAKAYMRILEAWA